ncbi:MAG: DinB family protein [Saprospiraceae bacterium]
MPITSLNHTLDTWIAALQGYDFDLLLIKPAADDWSLGQVFIHLLHETNYYAGQIEACLKQQENTNGQMAEAAQMMFANNALPEERIQGDPQSAQKVLQPSSKAALLAQMQALKTRLNTLWSDIVDHESAGKTQHPGLGYFNAMEWLQFADMHLRHHLRQKSRIEAALKIARDQ